MSDVVPIALGFALTTVAGGWWAARLQATVVGSPERPASEGGGATARFQPPARIVSLLLDKRLYRMRRVYWAIESFLEEDPAAKQRLDARLSDYDDVLYEWNDRLNVNLALLGSHFGPSAREYLYRLYEDFRRVGAQLETAARHARHGIDVAPELRAMDGEFEGWHPQSLNQRVYLLGLAMMTQLREGLVGARAPDKLAIPTLRPETHE